MPVVQIKLNADLDKESKGSMVASFAGLVASVMGKPLQDVMVICSTEEICMDGNSWPAAFIDFRCISGLNMEIKQKLCEGMRNLIGEFASVQASRLYVNFSEVDGEFAWRFVNNEAVCPKSPL